ncbi:MAG TPA: aminotransferase class V-fold PLP-dependent enzyme [Vicinamibacterales bacterium]|nr:aminotransferase class V-fold PLP-dependent enzyme [Vicinamibacterales bacterium]
MNESDLLRSVAERSIRYRAGLPTTPVTPSATAGALRAALGTPTPEHPSDPAAIVHRLADIIEAGGLMAMDSGRFFGFVIGGATPAALGADWLVSAWDQNTGLFAPTPGTSIVEEVTGRWLLDLLGLPAHASFAFVTGGQMANTTALAAARHHVLAACGWDVEADGLAGAPPIQLVVGEEVHVTVPRAARFLGLGSRTIRHVKSDDNGAMLPAALEVMLAEIGDRPTIVCCQAGNVNTGALDPVDAIAGIAQRRGAWLHVDGAIGLWTAACRPSKLPGLERADSWSTDAHKWLNVPYDCGITICRHPASHRAAMTVTAEYLVQAAPGTDRDPVDWNPEFSRRARAVPVYAAIATLGRSGLVDLVERCCAHARRFAARLAAEPGVAILNDVMLNQVLVRFLSPGGSEADSDARTRAVIAAVQRDATCWMGGSVWRGRAVMRISVSNHATTTDDVDRSVAAVIQAARQV